VNLFQDISGAVGRLLINLRGLITQK